MPTKYAVIKARRESDPEYAERLKEYARKYRELNRDKERERQRLAKAKKRELNRAEYNAKMREYNAINPPAKKVRAQIRRESSPDYAERIRTRKELSRKDYEKHWKLKQTYGIGIYDLNIMKEKQNYCCAVCGVHENEAGIKGLTLDHCHTKGHVRGLLCGRCNIGIGQFKDDISLLQKAISYLTNEE